jgi:hypothetical protein
MSPQFHRPSADMAGTSPAEIMLALALEVEVGDANRVWMIHPTPRSR